LLDAPWIKPIKKTIECKHEEQAKLLITYEEGAETKWIFTGQVISEMDPNYIFESELDVDTMHESLTIESMQKTHQGIYTIEVSKEGCATTETIYLSMT